MKNFSLLSFSLLLFLSMFATKAWSTTDKYRLIFRDNPSTSIVVAWNQVNGANPIVYYDTIDHGTNFAAYAFTQTVSRSVSAKGMSNQFARLTGLRANKVYYFVIKDDNSTSARYSFKTIPNVPTERLSIIAGGDSRNNQVPRQNANKLVARLRAHAVFFGGDMTDTETNGEWQQWFDDWQHTIAPDGRMTAIIPARGNHELNNSSITDLFDVVSPDVYFANSFGGNLIRFYTLNSNIAVNGAQASWLLSDLQANNNSVWKAAQYHHPVRPHVRSKSERNDIMSEWVPHFEQYGVNFVVECDAHTVKSTYPIKYSAAAGNDEGFIRDNVNGIVYIGEGCWGAPLRANDDSKSWTRSSGAFNQFKLIYIDMNKIEIRTIMTDNASSVGFLNDNNIFTFPSNLSIWNPAEGDMILIENYRQPGRPNVSLASPLNGQTFTSLSPIQLAALANDTDGGSVDSVQFFVNNQYVGTSIGPSFRFNWTPPSNGIYIIHAKAFDNDMKLGRSNDVMIQVYGNTTRAEFAIIQSSDDAEQYTNGTVNLNSDDLEFTDDTGLGQLNQKIGLRFSAFMIPAGATITRAYLQFTCDEVSTGASSLSIRVEDALNPGTYTTTNNNIGSRATFGTAVSWSPPDWNTVGEAGLDQQSSNLAPLVQFIVNKSGWVSGNAISFIISGTGQRIAESFDGDAAPRLIVEYSMGNNTYSGNIWAQVSNSDDDAEESVVGSVNLTSPDLELVFDFGNQKVGIRFPDLNIPKGATIVSAYLQFMTETTSTGTTNLTIKLQDDPNPASFEQLVFADVSGRPTLSQTVSWSPASWTVLNGSDQTQRSPNLATMVQALVNKPNWKPGSGMVFVITGTGERNAHAYDGDPKKAPRLFINYTLNITPISPPNYPDLLLCGNDTLYASSSNTYAAYFWNDNIAPNQPAALPITSGGQYTVKVMDAFGQVTHDTFMVTTAPGANPDLGPDQTYTGTAITLSPANGPYSSYLWSTGSSSSSIQVLGPGTYSVTVTNSFGCSAVDVIVITAPVALNSINNFSFKTYPNPANQSLNIESSQKLSEGHELRINDLLGRIHHQKKLSGDNWQVDISSIPSGAYWLSIQNNKGQRIWNQQLIIQH